MKSKILGIGVALPVAVAGMLGFSQNALAASFSGNDTLNLFLQIGLDQLEFNPATGTSNIPVETLFSPLNGSPGVVAPVGQRADINFSGNDNTGAFAFYNDGSLVSGVGDGLITSFDFDIPASIAQVQGLDDPNIGGDYFMALNDGTDFRFVLSADVSFVPPSPQAIFTKTGVAPSGNELLSVDFIAFGNIIDLDTGEQERIRYDFSAQGLEILSGSCNIGDPCTTNNSSQSATVKVSTITEDIPESSNPGALVALVTLGMIACLKRNQLSKS